MKTVSQRVHDGHRVMRNSDLKDDILERVLLRVEEGTEFTRDEATLVIAMFAEACDHFGVRFVRDRMMPIAQAMSNPEALQEVLIRKSTPVQAIHGVEGDPRDNIASGPDGLDWPYIEGA